MFAPSLAAEKRDGVRVTRQPYPVGVAGVKLSLEKMAQLIREGALSKKVMGWSMDVLRQAGLDGRDPSHTNFRRACAILDAVREATIYTQDPPQTELMKSAEAMLCLREGLCIRGGDCDDQVILVASCCMSVGIPCKIIKQTFPPDAEGNTPQEHVLLEAQNDDGSWFPMDPSTRLPCGQKLNAESEFRVDPSNPSTIGLTGAPDAELVGIGNPKGGQCGDTCCGTTVCTDCASHGKKTRRRSAGMGALPAIPAVPAATGAYAQSSTDLQNQVVLVIQAGDTYYNAGEYSSAVQSYQAAGTAGTTGVGPEIDLAGAANVTSFYTQTAAQTNTTLQEIAGTDQASADSARTDVMNMLALYQQALAAGQQAIAAASGGVPTTAPQMTLGTAAAWALGGGVVLGIAWNMWRRRR